MTKTASSRKHASRWSQGIRIQKAISSALPPNDCFWCLETYHCLISFDLSSVKKGYLQEIVHNSRYYTSAPFRGVENGTLTSLVHHRLHWHVRHALQLVVDD
jgi:hypothetical protein